MMLYEYVYIHDIHMCYQIFLQANACEALDELVLSTWQYKHWILIEFSIIYDRQATFVMHLESQAVKKIKK